MTPATSGERDPAPANALSHVAGGAVTSVWIGAVAAIAFLIGTLAPAIGPAVAALICGVAIRSVVGDRATTAFMAPAGRLLLQFSIVALGMSIGIADVLTVSRDSLPIMLTTVFGGLFVILLLGRQMGVDRQMSRLLAVGTSICGASAIAATAPIVGASSPLITSAICIIFIYNGIAALLFPLIGHAIGLAGTTFAVWAGTAVNDTSSVIAASVAFGPAVVAQAATVKLSRTLMIIPVTIVMSLLVVRDAKTGRSIQTLRRAIPWFAVAFLGAAMLNGSGLVPSSVADVFARFATLGSVLALSAVGLSTDLRQLAVVGPKAILLAGLGWFAIAGTSLILLRTTSPV
jgi:uncharacterized integral membrane protein (TIGR00698 family)